MGLKAIVLEFDGAFCDCHASGKVEIQLLAPRSDNSISVTSGQITLSCPKCKTSMNIPAGVGQVISRIIPARAEAEDDATTRRFQNLEVNK